MSSDPEYEARVRLRAYQIYQGRLGGGGQRSATDDWLLAEAEMRSARGKTAGAEDSAGTWRNVEPLLKWAAVAYGFGFVVVMMHTRALGIPVIQLLEPINILIGLPLAVVMFFLDKIGARFKRKKAELLDALREAEQQREKIEEVKDWIDPQRLYDAITFTLSQANLMFSGTEFWLPAWILKRSRNRILKLFDKATTPQQQRASLLKAWGLMSYILDALVAIAVFVRFLGYVAVLVAACALYVTYIYPNMPQTIGGGKPITVRMIVNSKKIPQTNETGALFPARESAKETPIAADSRETNASQKEDTAVPPGEGGKKPQEAVESMETRPITLHYQTEAAYYVSSGNGPIISLDHKAVDGIIFVK